MVRYADLFLTSLGSSTGTIQTYRYGLARFHAFLKATRTSQKYNNQILVNFYTWLVNEDFKPTTVNNYLAALRRFLTWLEATERIGGAFVLSRADSKLSVVKGRGRTISSASNEADPRIPETLQHVDDMQGVDALKPVKRLTIKRTRALVHTLYATGARVTEVISLTKDMIGYDGQEMRAKVMITGKGNKRRALLFNLAAREAIVEYLKERRDLYEPVFISHGRNGGKALRRGSVNDTVKHVARVLGLRADTSPHSFRHFRAQQWLTAGMRLESVQTLQGHESIETTRRIYAPYTSIDAIRSEIDELGL